MTLTLTALLGLALATTLAVADSKQEDSSPARQERLRQAAPPEKVLEQALSRYPGGRVLKMELEDEEAEGLVYEVKILTPEGRVMELKLQAHDLKLLREKGGRKRHEP
ncbi:MAG: PepSY domain-containing protein [Magnetococcales bacterium]|nr:PepSY domain-containing protein [Magnetococcales bacterium]